MSDCRLILGDALDVLRGLPSGSVDAVVTDPPYCSGGYLEAQKNTKAQGLRGSTVRADNFRWFASDNMSTGGLLWLMRSMMCQINRLLRPQRSAFVFTDWRMVPHLAPALESCGLRWRNMLVWDKGNAGLGAGFKPRHEIILEFAKGSPDYQGRTGQNVIPVSRVANQKKEHGAQKPVELIAYILRHACPPGGTVLDPFAGSGTTGVAAAQLGLSFVGVERDPEYHALATRRLDTARAAIA